MNRRLWDCNENSKAVCFGYDFEVCSAKILSKEMLSMHQKKNFWELGQNSKLFMIGFWPICKSLKLLLTISTILVFCMFKKKWKIIAFKFMLSMRQKLFWHMFSMDRTFFSAHSACIGNFLCTLSRHKKFCGYENCMFVLAEHAKCFSSACSAYTNIF